ncbi:MAG: hypothetical protein SNJ72_07275 [Fimbriimonadales bacterium]
MKCRLSLWLAAFPCVALAQQTGDGIAGAILLYLTLSGVGLLGITLFGNLARRCLQGITRAPRTVVIRGGLITLGFALVVLMLGLLSENVQAKEPVQLVIVLLLMGFALLVLLGFGAVVWNLGTLVLTVFGRTEVMPGWAVLVGTAILLAVVWIPLFGWALGLYWLFQAVGGVLAPMFDESVELPRPSE